MFLVILSFFTKINKIEKLVCGKKKINSQGNAAGGGQSKFLYTP